MKWFRLIATLLLVWATTGPGTARAMTYAVESGVPLLHNYAPADYAAAPQNWAVVQDHRGVVYVGNSDDGVLEFDGNHWRRITIPNQSAVLSLAVDANGRVYVGAVNELGYLAPDAQGSMHYVSMRDRIAPKFRNFSEVRRIFINSDGVYFQTSEQLLRIRDTRIDAWMPRKSFHLAFQVDDQIYIREDGRGLLKLIGDRLEPVPGGERFAEEKVYVMVPWEAGSTLVGTRTQGWFVYDGHHFRAWPTEADNAFKRDQIYKAQWLADGTLAVATLQGGLSLLDRHGHIVEHLRRSDGLINDTVLALSQDRQNGLWLALDKGISRLDVATPLTHFTQGSGLDGTVLALQRHQGVLYAGTTKGLFRLQQASDGNARFSLIPGIQAQVWAFLDLGDTLLVATSQGLFETHAGVVLPCPTGPCLSADFNSSLLRSRWDPSRIFIGLRNGVASIRREQGRWINEGNINGDTGLIRSMAEDAKGNLWLGTVNNGAIRIALPADWP
ncbi:MAG: ligand-binding sensor domain-containing protein, partial [Rhodanobacter sp.]